MLHYGTPSMLTLLKDTNNKHHWRIQGVPSAGSPRAAPPQRNPITFIFIKKHLCLTSASPNEVAPPVGILNPPLTLHGVKCIFLSVLLLKYHI